LRFSFPLSIPVFGKLFRGSPVTLSSSPGVLEGVSVLTHLYSKGFSPLFVRERSAPAGAIISKFRSPSSSLLFFPTLKTVVISGVPLAHIFRSLSFFVVVREIAKYCPSGPAENSPPPPHVLTVFLLVQCEYYFPPHFRFFLLTSSFVSIRNAFVTPHPTLKSFAPRPIHPPLLLC